MKYITLIALFVLPSGMAWAVTYHGRATMGTFVSQEKHEPEPGDLTGRNDFATFSSRLYYKASEFYSNKNHLVLDLRDKHDFFDKLDKERQELSSSNEFQLRQLNFQHVPRRSGMVYKLGRFYEPKAGSSFIDGIGIGHRLSPKFEFMGFAGLNPKRQDQTYLEFDDKSQTYGLYVDYVRGYRSFSKDFTFTNALVVQQYDGEIDRQYLYNYFKYQTGFYDYFQTQIYYDFEPDGKIQNGVFTYNKLLFKRLRASLQYFAYDVIEYRRREDIREILDPSPYQEFRMTGKWHMTRSKLMTFRILSGKRSLDELDHNAVLLKLSLPRFFSRYVDAFVSGEHRKKFTKTGSYFGFGAGYFAKFIEVNAEVEYGKEIQTDGSELSPLLIELAGTYRFSSSLFGSLAFQAATDEKVQILTSFFKLTYRFGNQGIAPIRDGAAPRGRL
ncbi:MAG: hypothetical protein KDD61_07000 [Bdellovibrionales bacterium]|nr:hypothetical protein [Bdellovibrionales bacterium]